MDRRGVGAPGGRRPRYSRRPGAETPRPARAAGRNRRARRRIPRARPRRPAIRILAVVPDLFFATKLAATARAAGADLEFVAPEAALARCAADPPARVLLDLHAGGATALARALKADAALARIPLTGFYSHVEADLRRDAREAGVDEVLPRSAFVRRLPELFAGAPTSPPTAGGDA